MPSYFNIVRYYFESHYDKVRFSQIKEELWNALDQDVTEKSQIRIDYRREKLEKRQASKSEKSIDFQSSKLTKQRGDKRSLKGAAFVNVPSENVPSGIILNSRKIKLLSLIKRYRNITTTELATRLSCSRKTVSRDLQELQKKDIVKRLGNNFKGHWIVTCNKK